MLQQPACCSRGMPWRRHVTPACRQLGRGSLTRSADCRFIRSLEASQPHRRLPSHTALSAVRPSLQQGAQNVTETVSGAAMLMLSTPHADHALNSPHIPPPPQPQRGGSEGRAHGFWRRHAGALKSSRMPPSPPTAARRPRRSRTLFRARPPTCRRPLARSPR